MILFPAIDLKDGECVRLVKGEMEQATVYNENPGEQAQAFLEHGLSRGCMSSISTARSPAPRGMTRRSNRSSGASATA